MQYACWKMYSIQEPHFGFGIISFLRGENKVPFHVSVHRPDESDWALQI